MDYRIHIAINLMKLNLPHGGSLRDTARLVGLSSSRLRALFKTTTGFSPIAYLRMLRMETARDLLDKTELTIPAIAIRIGLIDRSHFEREFKKYFGETPSQCRAALRLATLNGKNFSLSLQAVNKRIRHSTSVSASK